MDYRFRFLTGLCQKYLTPIIRLLSKKVDTKLSKITSFELMESESISKRQFCVCSAYANPDYDVGIDVSLKDKPMINVKTNPEEFLDRLRRVFKVFCLIRAPSCGY